MNRAVRNIDHQSAKQNDNVRNSDPGQNLLVVFRERAEARCLLVSNGLMTLQDAVDQLQESAVSQGLLEQYGQDEIQQILGEAFGRWRLE
jgi:hypothetical protein